MPTDASSRRRDRTAILGSIAFHLCVLTALLAVRPASFPADEPDERALLAGMIRVERAPPRPPPRPATRLTPAPAPPRPQPVERPRIHVAIAHEKGQRQVVAAEPRYAAPVAQRPAPRHTRFALALATPAPPTPPPVAPPSATPSPAPSTVLAARDAGPGNFGESYPARPMPGMLDALRTRLSGHAVMRVDVDEHGRAITVTIVSGIDDPALRDEVTRALLAASYIPASCNGLGCAATVELRT